MTPLCLALVLLGATQDPQVSQAEVDAAIDKGLAFLRAQTPEPGKWGGKQYTLNELVLWTFVHAGVPESDPYVQTLLKEVLNAPLERTYLVALRAMILEELDRVNHQGRIVECAQFLVDNQAQNGQWSYGEPVPSPKDVPGGPKAGLATATDSGNRGFAVRLRQRDRPKVMRLVKVEKRSRGPNNGDNSNSQYAMLGLRACADAGVIVSADVLRRAQRWWRESQCSGGPEGQGWCYKERDETKPYASMTAGALGSLAICDFLLGESRRNDRAIAAGVAWMTSRFSVMENVGPPQGGKHESTWMYFYYLYALERLGALLETDTFGSHAWYPEGAAVLLKAQQPNGAWMSSDDKRKSTTLCNTCFAILFLRRGTPRLTPVATVDERK